MIKKYSLNYIHFITLKDSIFEDVIEDEQDKLNLIMQVKNKKLIVMMREEIYIASRVISNKYFDKKMELKLDMNLKAWELVRGLFNNKINAMGRGKEVKSVIIELWDRYFSNIRKRNWVNRCKAVIEIEKMLKRKAYFGIEEVIKKEKRKFNEEKN
ncbi:hypothetical protein RhiirA4_427969 [Rhizophagus irregularis]|uniref:Uncharacterized protein n=1 Tax=Rhizophagus irregularis TaxID=588596 RepID=A0A2I1HAZ1_9GLOM|nr:hypothetical protein RhiirA4_427969 [Rhizophagus irregularis]